MNKLVSKYTFCSGFVFAFILFIFANVAVYFYTYNNPHFRNIGFPLSFLLEFVSNCPWSPCDDFQDNSFVFYKRIFILDFSIAIIGSLIFGLCLKLVKFVWEKIQARKLK
ncbi:MAG TPA: hypothetical protein PKY59_04755 [Pyrinomonadaceae bacterium]|nr:hypothetical protein [Pyrinomonadaceae bacterium]